MVYLESPPITYVRFFMKIAYLIVAHKLPNQLKRLVDRLEGPDVQFFIHVDAKSPQREALMRIKSEKSSVCYIPSQLVRWAHMSQIEVTLSLLQYARQAEVTPDVYVLLSGQDYPIKTNDAIQSFFEAHAEASFVEHFPLPTPRWHRGGLDRLERYHFYIGDTFFSYPYSTNNTVLQRLLNPFLRCALTKKRSLPNSLRFYGGSNWLTLSHWAVLEVLNFVDDQPRYKKIFNYSCSSDEIFFQTILKNLDNPVPINNQRLHYCDWSLPKGPNPAILTREYLEVLKKSPALFARKFDETVDGGVLDLLDE